MTDDLQPGDEVWVKATVVEAPPLASGAWVRIPNEEGIQADEARIRLKDIRKSLPSKQSETAELERKVVEAARAWVEERDCCGTDTVAKDVLIGAVEDLDKALAPSSLEDEIAAFLREHPTLGPEATAESILALVKAHES